MIHYVVGDLFRSPAKVLVNTVNTQGVMGKGLAKDFKAIYPEMFKVYRDLCDSGKLTVGKLQLYRTHHKWVSDSIPAPKAPGLLGWKLTSRRPSA